MRCMKIIGVSVALVVCACSDGQELSQGAQSEHTGQRSQRQSVAQAPSIGVEFGVSSPDVPIGGHVLAPQLALSPGGLALLVNDEWNRRVFMTLDAAGNTVRSNTTSSYLTTAVGHEHGWLLTGHQAVESYSPLGIPLWLNYATVRAASPAAVFGPEARLPQPPPFSSNQIFGLASGHETFGVLVREFGVFTTQHLQFYRIAADGTLPPNSLVLRSIPFNEQDPLGQRSYAAKGSLTFANGKYLAVWADRSTILAARITPDQTLVDTTPLTLLELGAAPTWLNVVTDASGYLLTWGEADNVVRGARLGSDLSVQDPQGFQIAAASSARSDAVIEYVAPYYVSVWREGAAAGGDLWAARVSAATGLVDVAPLRLTGHGDIGRFDVGPNAAGVALLAYERTLLGQNSPTVRLKFVDIESGSTEPACSAAPGSGSGTGTLGAVALLTALGAFALARRHGGATYCR
jgi:hypothetical protein